MIDSPIVDTHVHLWDPQRLPYPWLTGVPRLNRAYLVDDYRRACGEVAVAKIVFVQADTDFARYREEVEWVTAVAAAEPRLAAIVAWAPLERGTAAEPEVAVLAARPLVRGVRRIIQSEEDIGFCLRPDFVHGVQLLARHDLTFDICINHRQLANTIKLVEQCPEVTFVLDHIGKPDIRRHLLDPWRAELRTLSTFPNVWCKLSGLVTEADHAHWTRDDLKPYVDHVVECFGFARTMYGSDWPVAVQATDCPRWVETLAWAVSGCSTEQLRNLFHDNALAFYRLDPDEEGET